MKTIDNPVLFCLNLFYKNDTPEGFGIGLTPDFFEGNPNLMENVINLSQMTINHYKTLTIEDREQLIKDSWEQLEECRAFLVNNRHRNSPNLVFGSEETELSDESFQCLSLALDNISFLESLGLLPSDEYNGIQWTWIGEPMITTSHTYH
jgi:hypothetical protein